MYFDEIYTVTKIPCWCILEQKLPIAMKLFYVLTGSFSRW